MINTREIHRHFRPRLFFTYVLLFVFGFLITPLVSPEFVAAEEDLSELQEDFSGLVEREQEIRETLRELETEKVSLIDQINYLDTSISLTQTEVDRLQLQIDSRQSELSLLTSDIGTLATRIDRLGEAVDYQTEIYKTRATASYKASRVTPLELLLSAQSPGDLVSSAKYLHLFETQDRTLLIEMAALTDAYSDQKDLLQAKRQEVEDVKADIERNKGSLVSKQTNLAGQKNVKAELLDITKSDEAVYQDQLEHILAEQRAIENAIAQFTSSLIASGVPEGSDVSGGDVVGIQGSTGNSTGDHVHFGVYVPCGSNWCHTDPRPYIDSGELDWPLADFTVSQEYGATDFAVNSGLYANQFHNGIDIYGPINSPVLASADGVLTYSVDSAGGKGAIVYHSDDLMSLYWHIK